ncbi:hypothetical protein E2C01_040469 [Portunus trituberculatus]|uniref:Uncharacterized protein n=1 Tax=Portunus trituberculatus TaxID=210409 RepID=A0A5B7FJS8_PORTR|nr:hypothetical protein [Portunus trituberculatus]
MNLCLSGAEREQRYVVGFKPTCGRLPNPMLTTFRFLRTLPDEPPILLTAGQPLTLCQTRCLF